METDIKGYYSGPGGVLIPTRLATTKGGALRTAQSLPPYAELAREGYGFSAMTTSAGAALVVRPSTTSLVTLWNGEQGGGKSLIIDRAFAHNLVGTANGVYGLWLCIHPVGMTKPTNDITVRNSNSGKVSSDSLTIMDAAAGVNADGWFPWGKSGHTVTITTPGEQLEAIIEGRLIVPPSAAISLAIVADVTGATFTAGFSWYEKVIDVNPN